MFIFLDVTKPVLSNCPTDMTIDAYTKPSFSPPSVSDNSGTIKTFTISPENANTTMLITTSTETVTYTATDYSGNSDSCSFDIKVRGPPFCLLLFSLILY